jgi:hypothetical protein
VVGKKLLPDFPAFRIAFGVKTGDYDDPTFPRLEENSVREPPHSGPADGTMDNRELKWVRDDCLNRRVNRPRKAVPKFRADVVIPSAGRPQFGICLPQPGDWQSHDFLNSPALTCSQGMTSEGFFSCLSIRRSSSARCASVSDAASASRLSHTASSSSAFSAADRLPI